MAGVCGVRILLLWTGIIGLANCPGQGRATTAEPPPSLPQCSYTVSKIQFGLQIDITSSTSGSYSININEEARPQSGDKSKVDHSSRTSTRNIIHLKPCTTYEHAVAFIDSTGKETTCKHTGKGTTELTSEMKNGDVTEGSCFPDHVCYRSEWDIGSSMSASNNVKAKQCPNNDRVFCIKPGNNDICTDLTTTFTSGNCVKSTFSLTKSITVDFLNPSEIKQEIPTGLPANIIATFPPNCKNLIVDYTCLEKSNPSESRRLWELEPFTDYTCTGQIKHNNVIVKNTTTIEFDIDCDLTTEITEERETDTSFEFSWTTTSQRCKDVTKDPKFSDVCSCTPTYKHDKQGQSYVRGGTCSVDGLEPFIYYTCEVQPTYNNKKVGHPASVKKETDVGIPEEITAVETFVHDHNAINVTCREIKRFNGPKELYIARLFLNGAEVSKQEKVRPCKFEFKDLSYSTTYRVQVNAYNGRFEGIGKSDHKDTLYNKTALIVCLILIPIFFTCLAVAVVIYRDSVLKCRRSNKNVNEDLMLESQAIYVNVPRS